MPDDHYKCALHDIIQGKVFEMEKKQSDRPCGTHENRLQRVEDTNMKQWDAIDSLKRMVYLGAGGTAVLAFLGSILGAFLKK